VTSREKGDAVLDRLPDDRMVAAVAALEAVNGCDVSFGAIRDHSGPEPGRVTDFETNYGPVQPPDGEG